ncbi:MAG: symmetrical bis(5'-nucleosyl)-tetraphosphatase [Halomonadaceae bacterium]|nr:MAG: symmetrical bis(5'-nucleosyl)-tetraphosphatase [Halomonadaceae bacterium]
MSEYAIGDIHGCYNSLRRLLDQLRFDPGQDRLWLVGDIVNRGPDSLRALRFVRDLGDGARTVLGNHDLHLLAVAMGDHTSRRKDTMTGILTAPDKDELMHWLRHQSMACYDSERDLLMVHAGVPAQWSVAQTCSLAAELEAVLQGEQAEGFFRGMYGNQPACWSSQLEGIERWRSITNYLTRMRFVAADGTLDLATKDDTAADGFAPWFSYPRQEATGIIFGHWAALEGKAQTPGIYALDTGCVYGGTLTALNMDTRERISIPCSE